MTALLLGALAVILAAPAPALLGRLDILLRAPRAAIALWQAVALAAVLSALGSGLAVASIAVLDDEPGWRWLSAGYLAALALTAVVLGRLLLTAHRFGRRTRQLRRRHRELVDLLADGAPGTDGVRVLEHDAPTAYCLPGFHRARIVLSGAAVATLDQPQLAAVLSHERAHLRARHDLVLEAFTVLHRAFPRVVQSEVALDRVRLLIELLADAAAARAAGRAALARALVALSGCTAPEVALGAAGPDILVRLERLAASGRAHRSVALGAYLCAALILALPTVLIAAPWLIELEVRLVG